MSDKADKVSKILDNVIHAPVPEKIRKVNGSIYIHDKKWVMFKKHCKKYNKSYSDVIEQLITAYLDSADERGELDDLKKTGS